MRVLLAGLRAALARDLGKAARAAGAVALDCPVADALDMIGAEAIDAVVLNPRASGLGERIAKAIRAARLDVSLVFLVDGLTEAEEVAWLSLADDVVAPGRGAPILLARLRAVERRRLGHGANRIVLGGVVVDRDRRAVVVDGRDVALQRRLYAILELLVARIGRFVDGDAILEHVWSGEKAPIADSIPSYVSHLRRALREAGAPGDLIRVSRNRGYLIPRPVPQGRIAA